MRQKLYFARGPIIFAGVFFASSVLYLASAEAGCLDESGEEILDEDDCDSRVYGFKPATFVTMISIIAGLLSAIFMPVIGAIVDCTHHRKTVSITASVLLVLIKGVQAGISSRTWLLFTLLQALAVFVFAVQAVTMYAYQPDLAKRLGDERLIRCGCRY